MSALRGFACAASVALALAGCNRVEARAPKSPAVGDAPVSVALDVRAPIGVVLRERGANGRARVVCASPCETTVSTASEYELSIVELPDPPTFRFPRYSEPAALYVDTPRVFLPGAASVAGVSGAAVTLAGGAVMFGDLGGVADLDGALVPGAITAAIGVGGIALAVVFAVLAESRVVILEQSQAAIEF
ncbi:MAG: hypothetical protein U0271_00920 [Polyangiaceae bacterium]